MDSIRLILEHPGAQEITRQAPPQPISTYTTDELIGLLFNAFRLIEVQAKMDDSTFKAVAIVTYCELLAEVNRRLTESEQFQGMFG